MMAGIMMTGCGTKGTTTSAPVANNSTQTENIAQSSTATETAEATTETEIDWNTLVGNITFPEQYQISYEIDQQDGTVTSVTLGKDSTGNIYYKDFQTEELYVREGDTFIKYSMQNGSYVKQDTEKYKQSYIDDKVQPFMDCAKQNNIMSQSALKDNGITTIAGRECRDYVVTMKIINFEQQFHYEYDTQTGINSFIMSMIHRLESV